MESHQISEPHLNPPSDPAGWNDACCQECWVEQGDVNDDTQEFRGELLCDSHIPQCEAEGCRNRKHEKSDQFCTFHEWLGWHREVLDAPDDLKFGVKAAKWWRELEKERMVA